MSECSERRPSADVDAEIRAAQLVEIGRRCAERLPESVRSLDPAELLFHEAGLLDATSRR